jgi:predicted lipoprotein with Yx(FWY)xxD motif
MSRTRSPRLAGLPGRLWVLSGALVAPIRLIAPISLIGGLLLAGCSPTSAGSPASLLPTVAAGLPTIEASLPTAQALLPTAEAVLPTAQAALPTIEAAMSTAAAALPGAASAVGTAVAAAGVTAGGATVMMVQKANFGRYLTDSKGQTLYSYKPDTANTSTCYGSCASAWPPLLVTGAPVAGTGVNTAQLGTTKRTDGTTQVTYNGAPLYYYAGDGVPGDINGQGVGGVWYVLSPRGTPMLNGVGTPGVRPSATPGS